MSCMCKLCERAWDIRSFVYKNGNFYKLAGSYGGKASEASSALAWTKQLFSFLFHQCVFYVTAPPVTASFGGAFRYTASAVCNSHPAFALIGNTSSGLSMLSYVILGRRLELQALFTQCFCGLCGAFTKLISCRISQTHRKISPAAPLYDE